MEHATASGIRLPELVRYVDHLINSKEKRNIFDILLDLEEEYERNEDETVKELDVPRGDPSEKLEQERVSFETVPTTQSVIEPSQVESKLNNKGKCNGTETNAKSNFPKESVGLLPDIQTTSSPVRPTELLCRILSRNRKMKPEIFIPRMTLVKDCDSSQCSNGDSKSSSPRKKRLPHFNYDHGDGHRRNLPGEPELIRLLTDPEMQLGGDSKGTKVDGESNTKNMWMSLYGGTVGPPLVDRNQQRRIKRRRMLCKYCRRSPGDHQKWCIHYSDSKDLDNSKFNMVRSFTDDDIDPKSNSDKGKVPLLEKAKTTLDETSMKRDLPDHSTLHRDVYVRALSDRHTRLLMKQAHDCLGQTTKPFVFSYFDSQNGDRITRERLDGMEHIFGENQTDFTDYYKFLSNSDS